MNYTIPSDSENIVQNVSVGYSSLANVTLTTRLEYEMNAGIHLETTGGEFVLKCPEGSITLPELLARLTAVERENAELRTMIEYAPGGPIFKEGKLHFEGLANEMESDNVAEETDHDDVLNRFLCIDNKKKCLLTENDKIYAIVFDSYFVTTVDFVGMVRKELESFDTVEWAETVYIRIVEPFTDKDFGGVLTLIDFLSKECTAKLILDLEGHNLFSGNGFDNEFINLLALDNIKYVNITRTYLGSIIRLDLYHKLQKMYNSGEFTEWCSKLIINEAAWVPRTNFGMLFDNAEQFEEIVARLIDAHLAYYSTYTPVRTFIDSTATADNWDNSSST